MKLNELTTEERVSVIKHIFLDDVIEEKKVDRENGYILFEAVPMEEYDVKSYYKYYYETDTITVEFNYGDTLLEFEELSKNFMIMDDEGNDITFDKDSFYTVKNSNELEDFITSVSMAYTDCFEY